jgi:hypothetical protein
MRGWCENSVPQGLYPSLDGEVMGPAGGATVEVRFELFTEIRSEAIPPGRVVFEKILARHTLGGSG